MLMQDQRWGGRGYVMPHTPIFHSTPTPLPTLPFFCPGWFFVERGVIAAVAFQYMYVWQIGKKNVSI